MSLKPILTGPSETTAYGNLDVKWIHGSPSPRHRTDPPIQSHWYDENTIILRESKDVSFEAPFMYLLFGKERALLLDTGATSDPHKFPLRATIDGLTADWLTRHPVPDYSLIVAHSHGHRDHVMGDGQFSDRPGTTIVQKDLNSVQSFFNISEWPNSIGHLDLGGRLLDILPTPGHHRTHISIHDPSTNLLITGDTLYPGRLYIFDFPAFLESLNRLIAYVRNKPVSHIMGCHIEMTSTPKKDYPATTKYQPDEPPLQMTVKQLVAAQEAAEQVKDSRRAHVFNDFVIFNGPCYGAVVKQLVRASWTKLQYRLGIYENSHV